MDYDGHEARIDRRGNHNICTYQFLPKPQVMMNYHRYDYYFQIRVLLHSLQGDNVDKKTFVHTLHKFQKLGLRFQKVGRIYNQRDYKILYSKNP